MSINKNILKTFSDPVIWCQSYLKDPRDIEKPLLLRSYQRNILENTRKYKNIISRWGRRCLTSDTEILMYDETKKELKNIKVGDIVCSYYDNYIVPGKVINCFDNGIQDVYKIIFDNGSYLKCTGNHPILTTTGFKSLETNINALDKCLYFDKEIRYTQIRSIIYIGQEYTYDIEVENYHNFIANFLFVKNSGKSVTFCADSLWWAQAYPLVRMIEEKSSMMKPFRVVVVCPYESQIKELWNTYQQLVGDSPLLKDQLLKIRTSDVHLIEFKGQGENRGSTIEGHTLGISSSNQGTSLRSISADMLFVDEMDYVPGEIWERVIFPISTTHPNVKMRVCSTPSGKREKFYEICNNAQMLGWLHTHIPSWHDDNDNWLSIEKAKEQGIRIEDSAEFQVKKTTSSSAFDREYGAEFGEEFGGVYKHSYINRCLYQYGRSIDCTDPDFFDPGFQQHPHHKYIIGVDWNSYINGGQVVMVEYCTTPTIVEYYDDYTKQDIRIDFTGKYRLFYRRGIKSQEATQRLTRQEIIKLLRHFKIDYVYVDYGAGDTNIEELTLYGKSNMDLEIDKKLVVIDAGSTTEHFDPILGKKVKKRNKSLMVNFTALALEDGMIVLPKEEDEDTRLVGQMRSYIVKGVTSRGDYSYEGEDHILDAFNLAMFGFQQKFGQLINTRVTFDITSMEDPRIGLYPRRSGLIETPVTSKFKNSYRMPIRDPDKPVINKPSQRNFIPTHRRNIDSPGGMFGRQKIYYR